MFIIAYRSIFIVSAVESLAISPTCHPYVVFVIHCEILLVLGMTSDFQSKPGHFEFPKPRSYLNLLFYLVSSLTAPEGGRLRPRSCQVEKSSFPSKLRCHLCCVWGSSSLLGGGGSTHSP